MFIVAPLLSLVAMTVGGTVTAVAAILNGPKRLRTRAEAPLVLMPPVPTPEMELLLAQTADEPEFELV